MNLLFLHHGFHHSSICFQLLHSQSDSKVTKYCFRCCCDDTYIWVFPRMAYLYRSCDHRHLHCLESYPRVIPRIIPILKPCFEASGESYLRNIPPMQHAFLTPEFKKQPYLGGDFKYFLCSALLGEMIQFDEHIFQMGWNHQLLLETAIWPYEQWKTGCLRNVGDYTTRSYTCKYMYIYIYISGLFHKPLSQRIPSDKSGFHGMSQSFFHPFSEVKGSASVLKKGIPINQQVLLPVGHTLMSK